MTTTIASKYNLIFIEPRGRGRGTIQSANDLHENDFLSSIQDIHIGECEYLIEELDKAQQGKQYEQYPSFDWADLDIELNYPNVQLYDVIIPITEFKLLLLEWIDFNRKYNKNIL